ncbi:hypothetical protein [Gloeobacter morelensis]|uniref:Uncharacterized protein n=1 Tax=Gloeobacter morelensis MG652769 TaxID=2781736 RepID=A0ABY3PGB3_9CYAN|nr:hypothetical protein [Gloeobacter morelensis]UFP92592.1 hypothetical protein ISF26_12120 [Gloeobacter morelensis MG652769]
MADLINGPKSGPTVRTMVLWAAAACVGLAAIVLLVKLLAAARTDAAQSTPTDERPPAPKAALPPRPTTDLTGQYYCYSQLANLPPLYYQLVLSQSGIHLGGDLLLLDGDPGVIKGTLDSRGHLQFRLAQNQVVSSGGPFASVPFLAGALGSSKTVQNLFDFIGVYRKKGNEMLLFGEVKNQSATDDIDAKPRRFYCSNNRPEFWGKK